MERERESVTFVEEHLGGRVVPEETTILSDSGREVTYNTYRLESEDERNSIPVIFIPGFGGTKDTYASPIQGLVKQGFTVVIPDFPNLPGETDEQLASMDANSVRDDVITAAIKAVAVSDEKGNKVVQGVAHSKGCIELVKVAKELMQEKAEDSRVNVRNMVLVAPAGISEKGKLGTLHALISGGDQSDAQDAMLKKGDDREIAARVAQTNDAVERYKKKNMKGVVVETWKMAQAGLQKDLAYLRRHGSNIAAITYLDDAIFPPETYQQNLSAARVYDESVKNSPLHNAVEAKLKDARVILDELEGVENPSDQTQVDTQTARAEVLRLQDIAHPPLCELPGYKPALLTKDDLDGFLVVRKNTAANSIGVHSSLQYEGVDGASIQAVGSMLRALEKKNHNELSHVT